MGLCTQNNDYLEQHIMSLQNTFGIIIIILQKHLRNYDLHEISTEVQGLRVMVER